MGTFTGLFDHLAGDRHGRARDRPTTVEGQVCDGFGDLVAGDSVLDRALQMKGQLVVAIESDQRCNRHKATIARRQVRTFPEVAEKNFFAVVGERGGYVAEDFLRVRGCIRHDRIPFVRAAARTIDEPRNERRFIGPRSSLIGGIARR